ncbi:MAG: hypothetical protein H8E09_00995 [Gammaproteobacteria bacterium]|nr:hypothetical protein [Gammaproteobacteria bacterium]
MKYIFLFLIASVFVFQTVYATNIVQVDTTYLTNKSELVFEGEVVSTRSEQVASGYIYTYVDFMPTDVLIGTRQAGVIIALRFPGGAVGDVQLDVGSIIPTLGERGIYFVESLSKHLVNPLLGWSQGHFKIQSDSTLMAGNNQVVIGVVKEDSDNRSSIALSNGIAKGVMTAILNKHSGCTLIV